MNGSAVLVIGGAGYIGSHVCKALKEQGYIPVTFDNLSHGHEWAVKWGPLIKGDIHSSEDLDRAFDTYSPIAVIHLASHINVRESIENPGLYYHNNLYGSLSIAEAMVRHQVLTLVFSSSAAVYGTPLSTPIGENHPKAPLNPYGKTKSMAEDLFEDFYKAYGLSVLSLRYFNGAGADPEGETGEAHHPETHLIPRLIETAAGRSDAMTIYGDTSATRDYIHVCDLARAHCQGMEWLEANPGSMAINLGSGEGHSIQQVIAVVEQQAGRSIPLTFTKANAFEPKTLIADVTKARELLNWAPRNSELEFIVKTAWNWHEKTAPTAPLSARN
ncbi:MAG: UDP-glucose 4-epimerase [Chlamydiae bacterium]|nr:UDP-glucose 4-epimerase [Chlamydiota bacterium]